LLLALAAVITGCSSGPTNEPTRYRVSGTVTFDGKPVPYGDVVFTPDSAKKNTGPQGIAKIRDGKFDTSLEKGKGAGGGPTLVKVTGLTGEGGQPLCEYELKVDLPKQDSTQELVVPAEGKVKPGSVPPV
jgi:hypothetical protein